MTDFNRGFDESGVELVHHFCGGVYAKETHIPAGRVLSQHAHRYAHLSILAQGCARVEVGEDSRVVYAPACLTIAAGVVHKVTSLSPVVWYCIWPADVDESDPDVIDRAVADTQSAKPMSDPS